MYEVMAVAGAVWSCPYAWKGPALVTLGKEINCQESKQERQGVQIERVCDKLALKKEGREEKEWENEQERRHHQEEREEQAFQAEQWRNAMAMIVHENPII